MRTPIPVRSPRLVETAQVNLRGMHPAAAELWCQESAAS